jgi:phosphatidate cytidylyltransferase
MLKYRLIFGTLMTLFFIGVVLLDPFAPALFIGLVAVLEIAGLLELSKLASAKEVKILLPVSIPASIVLSTSAWWLERFSLFPFSFYLFTFLLAFSVTACFLYHRIRYGISGVIINIGGACFSILYLGLLGSFVPAVRIEFGPWHLFMLIFVVKCSDIGAYTFGLLFGKHKFSPVISPKKTWEGMSGGVFFAVIVAVAFAVLCGIMSWLSGLIFGVIFAFLGQLGDLAESMIKRDAEIKDSSNNVPGFGGVLDIVDSLLVTAPFGYLFFRLFQ